MTAPPTIVGASAGSGKTYRLTHEITRSIAPGSSTPIRIEGLVAVTYTRKAHAELAGRIRRAFVEQGAFDQAARLPVAYLGTVHAVCMRLLEEFALDAGLSPYLEVMPDDGGRRLRAAIEDALPPSMIDQLGVLARRLEIYQDARIARHDWLRRVVDVMELARSNRIAPALLPAMGDRATADFLALLPPAATDRGALDAGFQAGLDEAIEQLTVLDDGTHKTRDARQRLREIGARLDSGDARWSDWPRAAKIDPGRACRLAVAPLIRAASQYERHPGLREDVRAFTAGVFDAAARALSRYAEWKARRRLVDYADMVDLALQLVEDPAVGAELADRLDLVVVDEFQDTSPIQLALFTRLHRLAGRSVWVGDGKQCIFEYAGADPLLMDAVVTWGARQRGAAEQLTHNYRSRPELVDACSELFAQAFAPHGLCAESVRTIAARTTPAALAVTPPFGVWWLDTKNAAQDAEAIAEATHRLLDEPARISVLDRVTGAVRPVEARDVGVLAATNVEAKRIAGLLQRRGVRANLPRDGLMQTPEGVLLDAALRWVLEPGDRLSLATLEALAGWNGLGPDDWLASKLGAEGVVAPSWLQPLAGLRTQLAVLAPAEALDRAIHLLDAATLCARWPDPQQRLGNLDALRALASRYEERCARHREPATLAGLVRYFDETRAIVAVRDEERATDDQFSGATDDAVTVCTYHRAKGLEWPVVVLTSLDRKERRDAFDPCPESDRPGFDPADPLAGRWIRFWPWPFGPQTKLPLATAAASSPEGLRVADRERRERVRLLYVGFTRARDHLVLAARLTKGVPQTDWLDDLRRTDATPLLALPTAARDGASELVGIGARWFGCRVSRPPGAVIAAALARAPRRFARPPAAPLDALRYRIAPSQRGAEEDGARRYAVDRVHPIGPAVATDRHLDWETLGTAVHGFLAADPYGDASALRLATARRIIARAGLVGGLEPTAVIAMSDRLRATIEARWPGARWDRELPITAIADATAGRRRIEGVIDLLLTVADGVIIVDHKAYPAPSLTAVVDRATAFLPQLAAYADALERCGHAVIGACMHFPVAGAWVDLRDGP